MTTGPLSISNMLATADQSLVSLLAGQMRRARLLEAEADDVAPHAPGVAQALREAAWKMRREVVAQLDMVVPFQKASGS